MIDMTQESNMPQNQEYKQLCIINAVLTTSHLLFFMDKYYLI